MSATYDCARCGETFEYVADWTDQDAQEEYRRNFPNHQSESAAVVCDDCYQGLSIPPTVPPARTGNGNADLHRKSDGRDDA